MIPTAIKFCYLLSATILVVNHYCFAASLPIGPNTTLVDTAKYQKVYYISQNIGSDVVGDGSREKPWQSIQYALSIVTNATADYRVAFLVAAGLYQEPELSMKEHIDWFGGYDQENWQRDIFKHVTIIDGDRKHRILVGANNCQIDGFMLQAGVIRGRGAGLICDACSPVVSNSTFIGNQTKKPKNWSPEYWHEQANDGGAIYCTNGSKPTLINNCFVENRTEVGRGAAIAMHGHCGGKICHNVFLDNAAGTEDLDRSSDGGALSIFDWSSPRIENNILLENNALNSNDGGGMFVALWSSPSIRKNIFVGNRSADDGGALFVGGQEHRYDSPFDPMPEADKFCVKIIDNVFFGNDNRRHNSGGMRLTMQARATVEDNVLAHDARFQIQASEAKIENNTIIEDTLIEEMPKHTAGNLLSNNIFWARLLVRDENPNKRKRKLTPDMPKVGKQPRFIDDQLKFEILSADYLPLKNVTDIQLAAADLKANQLNNRVVRFARRWGVVSSNSNHRVIVWGDVSGNTEIVVLPSFKLHPESPGFEQGPKTQ